MRATLRWCAGSLFVCSTRIGSVAVVAVMAAVVTVILVTVAAVTAIVVTVAAVVLAVIAVVTVVIVTVVAVAPVIVGHVDRRGTKVNRETVSRSRRLRHSEHARAGEQADGGQEKEAFDHVMFPTVWGLPKQHIDASRRVRRVPDSEISTCLGVKGRVARTRLAASAILGMRCESARPEFATIQGPCSRRASSPCAG